jgi:lysyl endopeptidase
MTKTLLPLAGLMLGLAGSVFGQLSEPGMPSSFLTKQLTDAVPTVVLPALDLRAVEQEDLADEASGLPPRFGYPYEVHYNLENSGIWEDYPGGGRVWRLKVTAPEAISINFCYSDWAIPEGGKVWVYSADRRHVIGTFTERNAHPDGGYATGLVYGDEVILEYFEPQAASGEGRIALSRIVHGYRYVHQLVELDGVEESFGSSGACQVNVNCSPEGNNWQNEKRSVAMILSSGFRLCTGSMINTTRGDCTPYFLTAHHCRDGFDAVSNPNMSSWSFYWMYESPGCADGSDFLPPSTNGATMVANDAPSDFALLLLNESPADIAGVSPWFNGWNATTSVPSGGVGIHHPAGDIKKIATHSMVPLADDWFGSFPAGSHWEVGWDATPNGFSVTEGGSSGSPLYDANGRVIGQLHGGSSINCSDPANDPGIYGAMWYSLNNAGATDNRRKLSPWLDPDGLGTTVQDGTFGNCSNACLSPSGLNASSVTGTDAVLGWTAVSGAFGYEVRYREAGLVSMPWTNLSTAGTSVAISGLTACTSYEFQVATQCDTTTSIYSLSALFVTDGCPCPTYCTSGGGTVDEWIESVAIGGLVNNSGDNGGYVNFTGTPFTAAFDPGTTYSVTLTPGYESTIYGEWFHVYIDYNQDGDFNDAGELAYDAGGTVSGVPATGSLTIPATALLGSTGLRVVMVWNSAPTPCATVTYGETEDYCITIGTPSGCSSASAPANLTSSVGASSVTLSWDPVPESVACQVKGTRTSPAGPTGTQNLTGFEVSGTTVPFTVLGTGTTWDWQVRCACSISPVDATPFSAAASFSVPTFRAGDLSAALEAWPNPANEMLQVRYDAPVSGRVTVQLVDMTGRTVLRTETAVLGGNNALELQTGHLPAGHYLLQVMDGQGLGQRHLHIEH